MSEDAQDVVLIVEDDPSILMVLAAYLSGEGYRVLQAENGEQAKAALHRMAKENYAIIYITEHLAAQIPAEIERRREDVSPAVILIPGREGSLGIGTAGVHAAADKAVGADIL